jgi:hypothetical protein
MHPFSADRRPPQVIRLRRTQVRLSGNALFFVRPCSTKKLHISEVETLWVICR